MEGRRGWYNAGLSKVEFGEGEAVHPLERMRPRLSAWRHRLFLLAVALAVIGADQLTKAAIEQSLPLNASWAPIADVAHLFRFTHVSNTGAAFGLFPTGSLLFAVVAVAAGMAILVYNLQLPAGSLLLRLALGLQLGGALGNLADRLRLGHVTDFLDVGPWPVFNLADMAIVAGVLLLGLLMLLDERENLLPRQPEALPEQENAHRSLAPLRRPSNHETSG
jgi:signal peptidase II